MASRYHFRISGFSFQTLSHRLFRLTGFSLALITLAVALAGCSARRETRLAGRTMGTTYHVTVVHGFFNRPRGLDLLLTHRLEEIEQRFSTYRSDSEINRFNRWPAQGEAFKASAEFDLLIATAARIHALSRGAWDPTVRPLVDLWGFGPAPAAGRVPDASAIQAAREAVGFKRIRREANQTLVKTDSRVSLDLASIAKGYGVDALAALIRNEGYGDFLVEIGGEVFAAGRRPDGSPWRVGINQPRADASPDAVYRILGLTDRAMATSGDYRNFFESEGRRYAHIIDPRTGFPVANGVVSATVTAPDCTLADALATALCVMGPASGLAMIDTLSGVEALVLVAAGDGTRVEEYRSSGFPSGTVP